MIAVLQARPADSSNARELVRACQASSPEDRGLSIQRVRDPADLLAVRARQEDVLGLASDRDLAAHDRADLADHGQVALGHRVQRRPRARHRVRSAVQAPRDGDAASSSIRRPKKAR